MDESSVDYRIMDYTKGLQNCMGDLVFYKSILSDFLKDTCYRNAKIAYEQKDYLHLFEYLHEMKGVSGNVALSELYEAILPLLELLRKKDYDEERIERLFASFESSYFRTCDSITSFLSK